MSDKRVYLYDSTLRDGAQTQGVDFSVADKIAIAAELDRLGIDYIEGGWPGANPTDDSFFASLPALSRARFTSFGMTRRQGRSAENDPGLQALFAPGVRVVTMVGKSWDFQVEVALGIELAENLRMISDSIEHARTKVAEVMFDAEHFFDGFKANPDYALSCVEAAYKAGARWVVLCDTNGGALPHEITEIVTKVSAKVPGSHLGIHCHNDSDNAVANSVAAVRAGVRQVQGTLNGLGERCGNANLISIIANLVLKMGYETNISPSDMTKLKHVSRVLDERLNRAPDKRAPYVGASAFAHKGGLHVSAVEKDPRCYEHISPELVGNHRHVVVSNQAGRSNILATLRDLGVDVDSADPKVARMLEDVKQREYDGYAYDGAEASLELLVRRTFNQVPLYFDLKSFRVITRREWQQDGSYALVSEATVKGRARHEEMMEVAEGNGPVNALDAALRKMLRPYASYLEDLKLVDYKVRIFTPGAGPGDGTDAVTRVMIESADKQGRRWSTVGVSTNVVDASFDALSDSITYKLLRDGALS
ncbi:MAG: citramalate synthase [Rhodospirillales bacterium]|nr:citramalate synthase [Rhodospirillales bacterium]